jgi:hypothetical protein
MPKFKPKSGTKQPNQKGLSELGNDKRVQFNISVSQKTIESSKTGETEGRIIDRLIMREARPDVPFEKGPDMETEERFYI